MDTVFADGALSAFLAGVTKRHARVLIDVGRAGDADDAAESMAPSAGGLLAGRLRRERARAWTSARSSAR